MTTEVVRRLSALIAGAGDGPGGARSAPWLSAAFNEPPWLDDRDRSPNGR